MGKKLLFVNLSKNSHLMNLSTAEAERYGHSVYNLMDFPRKTHRTLRHVEYCKPTINDYRQAIYRMVNKYQIDYVLTQCDNLYPLLDSLDSKIKVVPTLTKCKVNDLMDKQKFYQFCVRHNIPQPHSIVATSVEEIMSEFDTEIFVKPTNGADGTVRLYMSEEKYSQFDYMKYRNPKHFIDLMEKHDAIDDFLYTQKNGREMKIGKGLVGIKGNHIIQECVNSRNHYVLNTIIADNQIRFTVIQKTVLPRDIRIYFLSYPHTEQYIIDKSMDNHGSVKDILGENIFKQAMNQIHTIIDACGMELGIFSVSMVSMGLNKIYLFDPHFRIGGGMAREIKTDSNESKDEYFRKTLFKDIEYHSIWEYV